MLVKKLAYVYASRGRPDQALETFNKFIKSMTSGIEYSWYLDPNNLPEDEKYYKTQITTTTHWGGKI